MGVYSMDDFIVTSNEYPWGSDKFVPTPTYALSFNGSSDYVDIGHLNPSTTKLTLEVWCKLADGALSAHRPLFSWGDWNEDVTIYFRSGGTEISVNAGIGGRDEVSYTDTVEGVWRHIALTIDTKIPLATVYMDGDELGTVDCQDGGDLPLTNDLKFGQYGNSRYFQGMMSDVRIWNIARTQQQIQDNMSKSLRGDESGLVAYYPFIEGEGTTLNDATGNGYDGTIYEATWVEKE